MGKLKKLASTAVWVILPLAVAASEPVERQITCPVGGEAFEIIDTASCSATGQRTLTMRPTSTCDYITRLPICPANGLPLYREFSDQEATALTGFVETQTYAALRDLAPWQRAYGVARHLGDTGSPLGFQLALRGLWFDPSAVFESTSAQEALLAEAEVEMGHVDAMDRAYIHTILAFMLYSSGRPTEGDRFLVAARTNAGTNAFLGQYIAQVSDCRDRMGQQGCTPQTLFVPKALE